MATEMPNFDQKHETLMKKAEMRRRHKIIKVLNSKIHVYYSNRVDLVKCYFTLELYYTKDYILHYFY